MGGIARYTPFGIIDAKDKKRLEATFPKPPPAPTAVPDATDDAVRKAQREQRRRQMAYAGRGSTIKTGAGGLSTAPTLSAPALTGA